MTHCSKEQREVIVGQYLNSGLSLREFADKEGIAKSTLYIWSKQLDSNVASFMNKTSLSAEQRFAVVLEMATLSESQLSEYCCLKGFEVSRLV